MNTRSMCFSTVLRNIALGSLLVIGAGYSIDSNAAQGCGYGFHMTINGRCVANSPGPNATPAPAHPGCWRNGNGALRCY